MEKLEDILKHIGTRITHYREQKDMNQSDLARELNKDRQFIQRIEKGNSNVTMQSLHEIASILEVEIIEFFK